MVKKTSLSLSKIKHSYNNNDFILNDINLDVSEGEIVAILGSSGSGKSTLLRLITGLEKLKYGKIEIFGETVASRDFSITPNNRNVGLVLQEKVLFSTHGAFVGDLAPEDTANRLREVIS